MRILLFLAALSVTLLAALSFLNWQAVNATVPLNLGVTTIEAPMAAVLLVLSIVAFGSLAIYAAARGLSHNHTKRVSTKAFEAQRVLVEQAEASRFNELRVVLISEFERLSATLASTQDALRKDIQDNGNSLAAMIAEIDDRAKAGRAGSGARDS